MKKSGISGQRLSRYQTCEGSERLVTRLVAENWSDEPAGAAVDSRLIDLSVVPYPRVNQRIGHVGEKN